MQKVLLLNHLSVTDSSGYLSDNDDIGKRAFLSFFKTVQSAINEHGFQKFIVSDQKFWEISPSKSCTLTELINSLPLTDQRWIYELYRLSTQTTLDFFPGELIERVLSFSPVIRGYKKTAYTLGCAACTDGVVSISFDVDNFWKQTTIYIDWLCDEEKVDHRLYDLNDFFLNVSHPTGLHEIFNCFQPECNEITKELWAEKLPTTDLLESFWDWFSALSSQVQQSLFKVICTIQNRQWHARKDSSFQKLVGNELCEVRCWPDSSATIRAYVKVESKDCVVFLSGSNKSKQDTEISRSLDLYKKYLLSTNKNVRS